MAEALLISKTDLAAYTSLNANVDADKVVQFVKIAQDIWIQQYTGSKLLNKIKADIVAGSLTGNYLTLVNSYLKPMLIHFTMVEFLPFHAYTIANKGIYKHNSENAETIQKSEVDFLIEKERNIAINYALRFQDYMLVNQSNFPEYNTNTTGDVFPDNDNKIGNWYI